MDILDQIIDIIVENEVRYGSKRYHVGNESTDRLAIRSLPDKPKIRLELGLVRNSAVVHSLDDEVCDLSAGNKPTAKDIVEAPDKMGPVRNYGPVKRVTFAIYNGSNVASNANFEITDACSPKPTFKFGDSYLQFDFAKKLGCDLNIISNNGQTGYIHFTRINSGLLGTEVFHIDHPLSCARFMHAAYKILVKSIR